MTGHVVVTRAGGSGDSPSFAPPDPASRAAARPMPPDPAGRPRAAATHLPGLDGLRAIAVAIVVAFHLDRLPGGFLGVDAFFVVSGWLITWKLLAEVDLAGTPRLGRFWSSRLRRLMPASLVVIASIAVLWPVLGIDVPSLRRDLVWAAGWMSNWGTITAGGDYWARFGDPSPLTHFWSLAIEEQFYLVWPLLVWLAARRRRGRRVAVGIVAGGLSVASIAFMVVWFDPSSTTATYMNTFARAHSLLIGALAAAVSTAAAGRAGTNLRTATRRLAPAALIVVTVVVATASSDADWLYRWGFPVFAAAMAVVVVATTEGLGARLLASRPLRWVGDRSYGLYLWHWPVILAMSPGRTNLDGLVLDAARVAVSVALADLSLRWIETPARRRPVFASWRAPLATAIATASVVVLAVALVPASGSNAQQSVVTLPPAAPTAPAPTATGPASGATDVESLPPVPSSAGPATEPTAPAAMAPAPAAPVRVLVAGDSTAQNLAEALLPYAGDRPDQLVAGSAAFPGCGLTASDDGRLHQFVDESGEADLLSLEGCLEQWRSIPVRVASDEQIDLVVVQIGGWDAVDIHLVDGRIVSVGDPTGRAMVEQAYRDFTAAVTAAGAELVWVLPPDVSLRWGEVDDPINDPARWQALREIIGSLGVHPVDLPAWLVATGLDGPEGRPDGMHLSPEAEQRFVAELLGPELVRIGAGTR